MVNPLEKLPALSPLSQQSSDTVLPVLSRVRGLAEPLTWTLLPPWSPSTFQKKKSTITEDQRNVRDPLPGPGSIQSESRSVPHSSLEDYNRVSSRRSGSVYGLRVVF